MSIDSKQKIYKVIVLPDMQVPFHDVKTLKAVEKYMADETWDEYVNLGDFMDFDCISRFNKENLRKLETQRILKDYDVANTILDRHQEIIRKNNPKAKFNLLQGNHEQRIEKLIDAVPQLQGLIEVELQLRLKERGFRWVRSYEKGEVLRIGKASFIHGTYTQLQHAKKHVEAYGTNIFYGHLHDVQAYTKELKGERKVMMGQSLGCLCKYDLDYMKGRPSKWVQAIGVFYFRPDRNFNHFVVTITNSSFIAPNGKFYD